MKQFHELKKEVTEAVTGKNHTMTGGSAQLKAKSGDTMSFTHHEQGKITGTFHKPISMGGRTYAGIEHEGTLHAVPVHQVTHVNGKEIKSHIPESVEHVEEVLDPKMYPEEVLEALEDVSESFAVGDEVIPNAGPHKGQKHTVIHDHGDGSYNIKPVGLKPAQIKYRLGAVSVQKHQITKA